MSTTVISTFTFLLLATITWAKPTSTGDLQNQYDSYAVPPTLDQSDDVPQDSPLSLDLVPPAVVGSSAPHVYYMGSDGIAEPAEGEGVGRILRKRQAVDHDETLFADQTVIIGPPSGNRPFGTAPIHLGYRPARAYYARRYHKYPWNYH